MHGLCKTYFDLSCSRKLLRSGFFWIVYSLVNKPVSILAIWELKYSSILGSISTKIEFRFSSIQTRPVVPEPAKKSRTKEPGYDNPLTNLLINSRGFWVGCPTLSIELPFNLPISHTLASHLGGRYRCMPGDYGCKKKCT